MSPTCLCPPLQFTGVFHTAGLTCPAISEIVLCCSCILLQPLAMFSYEHHLGCQPECSQCLTDLFPCLNQEHSQIFILPMALSLKAVLSIYCNHTAVLRLQKAALCAILSPRGILGTLYVHLPLYTLRTKSLVHCRC